MIGTMLKYYGANPRIIGSLSNQIDIDFENIDSTKSTYLMGWEIFTQNIINVFESSIRDILCKILLNNLKENTLNEGKNF